MDSTIIVRRIIKEIADLIPGQPAAKEKSMQRHLQFLRRLKTDIDTLGFIVMASLPDEHCAGFAYTIGLSETTGHPELLLFGLPGPVAHTILCDLAQRIQSGARFGNDDVVNEILNVPLAVKAVSHHRAEKYAVQLFNYYADKSPPAVLQLVLPDTGGRFPWSPDFDEHLRGMQPPLWNVIH